MTGDRRTASSDDEQTYRRLLDDLRLHDDLLPPVTANFLGGARLCVINADGRAVLGGGRLPFTSATPTTPRGDDRSSSTHGWQQRRADPDDDGEFSSTEDNVGWN